MQLKLSVPCPGHRLEFDATQACADAPATSFALSGLTLPRYRWRHVWLRHHKVGLAELTVLSRQPRCRTGGSLVHCLQSPTRNQCASCLHDCPPAWAWIFGGTRPGARPFDPSVAVIARCPSTSITLTPRRWHRRVLYLHGLLLDI